MTARIALICSILNEAHTVDALIDSIRSQTVRPDETIFVDGGSGDDTVAKVEARLNDLPGLVLIRAPGSTIAAARNIAIRHARADIIVSTDAGVRFGTTWLAEIISPLLDDPEIDVVAGFFIADPTPGSRFECALGAVTLPHISEVRVETFLPSSRSVAFRRTCWESVGGYPEWLEHSEDVVFDLALRQTGCRFSFAPQATVRFRPRSNLRSFYRQYLLYARGDGKAGLWTLRHAGRYVSYAGGALCGVAGFIDHRWWLAVIAGFVLYNGRSLRRIWLARRDLVPTDLLASLLWLPAITVTGDLAKMIGYPRGLAWRLRNRIKRP